MKSFRSKTAVLILAVILLGIGYIVYGQYTKYKKEVNEAIRENQIFLSGGPFLKSYSQVKACLDGTDDTYKCRAEYVDKVRSIWFACLVGQIPFEESPFVKNWQTEYKNYFIRK